MRTARYRQIVAELRSQILTGHYQPGDKLPTEAALAAQHHVSRVTSGAALTALAHEGLVDRWPRRGTIVRALQPLGATTQRRLIAWIQPDIDPPFGANVLRGVVSAAQQAGDNLLFRLSGRSRTEESQAITDAIAAGAHGIALFLQDGETYNAQVLRLVLDGFPLVLVDRYLRGVPCASVQSNNIGGARALVGELTRAGHRAICALIFPDKGTSTVEDRLSGYTQALADAALPADLSLHYIQEPFQEFPLPNAEMDRAVDRLTAYLRQRADITAIFAANAGLALLALRAAERLQRRVPDDLSIVSIDDVRAFPLLLRDLTCGVQQGEQIGRTAISLLHQLISGELPRQVVLPMRIEHNGSIAAPNRRTEAQSSCGTEQAVPLP